LILADSSIVTTEELGHGVVAGQDTRIEVTDTSIETSGVRAYGLVADQNNTSIIANNVNIVTNNDTHAYGVYAKAGGANVSNISINGGSIISASTKGQGTQDGDGSRGYAIISEGTGATVQADGTTIHTFGQRAYGAY